MDDIVLIFKHLEKCDLSNKSVCKTNENRAKDIKGRFLACY